MTPTTTQTVTCPDCWGVGELAPLAICPRCRGGGEIPAPNPVIVRSDNIKPHFERQPPAWEHTGPPDVMVIDANNPDHWSAYVWSHVASDAERRKEIASDTIPARTSGYEIGYYPVDVDSWEMIPDGPYCAACIDPHEYDNPNPRADAQYPQAYRAEMMDTADEDDDGNPIPRVCTGCGEDLYTPDEDDMPEIPPPHYHAVAFINGCLNDYDSGPYETEEEARQDLYAYIDEGGMQPGTPIEPRDPTTYVQGAYVLTVEECTERTCQDDI